MQSTDKELQGRIDVLEKSAVERGKKRDQAKVYQLPLWPEPVRGTPNPVLRGALFAAIKGKDARYLERELIACQKGYQIRFTGKQLTQSDLDVFEQALHLARSSPLGTRCEFSAYSFLKALGRTTGSSDAEWLKDVFARLTACAVELTDRDKKQTYGGSLLEFFRDEDLGRYVIEFNPKILAFYAEGWTGVDWESRKRLRGKQLALWLHGYLATHTKPYPVKVETILTLSGSRNRTLRDFKRRLSQALDELRAIGFIAAYKFESGQDGDLVSIERSLVPLREPDPTP